MIFFKKNKIKIPTESIEKIIDKILVPDSAIVGPKGIYSVDNIILKDIIITGFKQAGGVVEVFIDEKLMAKMDGSFQPIYLSHSFPDGFKIKNLTVKSPTILSTVFITHYKEAI